MAGSTVKAIKKVIVSTGRRGLDGASAYQVWLSNGNSGTIDDFIESLTANQLVFIQKDKPSEPGPYVWIETKENGDISLLLEDGK